MAIPPVFSVFNLPPPDRLPALRAHLDAGANPNSVDPSTRGGESLLGRVFSCRGEVNFAMAQELLDRGANPLRGQMWVDETGDMEPFFDRTCFLAWEGAGPLPQGMFPGMVQAPAIPPQVVHGLLQACRTHDHRDQYGHDALDYMVGKLRPFSFVHFASPIRHALQMGFPAERPFGDHANVVHYLLGEFSITTTPVASTKFHAAWEFIADFIDAGADMRQQDNRGRTGWEVVDACAPVATNNPGYTRVQAHRQAGLLDAQTPDITRAAPARRM